MSRIPTTVVTLVPAAPHNSWPAGAGAGVAGATLHTPDPKLIDRLASQVPDLPVVAGVFADRTALQPNDRIGLLGELRVARAAVPGVDHRALHFDLLDEGGRGVATLSVPQQSGVGMTWRRTFSRMMDLAEWIRDPQAEAPEGYRWIEARKLDAGARVAMSVANEMPRVVTSERFEDFREEVLGKVERVSYGVAEGKPTVRLELRSVVFPLADEIVGEQVSLDTRILLLKPRPARLEAEVLLRSASPGRADVDAPRQTILDAYHLRPARTVSAGDSIVLDRGDGSAATPAVHSVRANSMREGARLRGSETYRIDHRQLPARYLTAIVVEAMLEEDQPGTQRLRLDGVPGTFPVPAHRMVMIHRVEAE